MVQIDALSTPEYQEGVQVIPGGQQEGEHGVVHQVLGEQYKRKLTMMMMTMMMTMMMKMMMTTMMTMNVDTKTMFQELGVRCTPRHFPPPSQG